MDKKRVAKAGLTLNKTTYLAFLIKTTDKKIFLWYDATF
jgi:hypothetical protein